MWPSKTEPGSNRKYEQTITSNEMEMWLKIFQQMKVQDQTASQWNSTKHIKKSLVPIFLKLFQKIEGGRNTPKYIWWSHHYPDTKTRQGKYKTGKLQANIFDEHRCKSPQQHISKLNPTIYKKDHTPWSSGIYSRNGRMVQHMQINQCDTPH